jgi:hypothetical protein
MNIRFPSLAAVVLAAGAAAQSAPCFETSFGVNIGAGDDTVSYNNPLGFTFPGPSGPVTAIDISSNGFLFLGTNGANGPDCCSGNASQFTTGNPRIAADWMDLYPPGAPASGGVFFNTIPASPGHPARAVITWSQCPEYYSLPNITAQIQLVSTGEIIINHDAGNQQPQNYHSPLVGVTQGGAAIANVVNFGTLPIGGVNTGTNPTAYQVYSIPPAYDLAGLTILFTPNGSGGYIITQVTNCAKNTTYGTGCINSFASFYEDMTASAFDLNNSSMTLLNTGTGYLALSGLATYQAPSPTALPLGIGDDGEVTVTLGSSFPYLGGSTPTLQVCSNGFVSVGVGNGVSYIPDVPTLLSNPQTGWYCWHDYNETALGSGVIKFEEVGNVSYVTWDGVWDYGGSSVANASTWQMQFDRTTGNVSWVWGTMSPLSGSTGTGFLVGYSAGGPSVDPGNRDISATLPATFTVGTVDVLGLALSGSPSPRLGNTVVFTTSNIPGATILTGHILSFGQIFPGVDLGFLGAPGCLQLINTAGSSSTLLFGSPTVTHNIGIPNNPIFAGMTFYSQSASLTPGVNPLGLLTSNGVASLINVF